MIHGGVPAIFSVLESSEVKFPALEGFVLPTYFPSRLGNLTRGTGKLAWQTDNKGLAAADIVDDRLPLLKLVVGQVVLSILSLN